MFQEHVALEILKHFTPDEIKKLENSQGNALDFQENNNTTTNSSRINLFVHLLSSMEQVRSCYPLFANTVDLCTIESLCEFKPKAKTLFEALCMPSNDLYVKDTLHYLLEHFPIDRLFPMHNAILTFNSVDILWWSSEDFEHKAYRQCFFFCFLAVSWGQLSLLKLFAKHFPTMVSSFKTCTLNVYFQMNSDENNDPFGILWNPAMFRESSSSAWNFTKLANLFPSSSAPLLVKGSVKAWTCDLLTKAVSAGHLDIYKFLIELLPGYGSAHNDLLFTHAELLFNCALVCDQVPMAQYLQSTCYDFSLHDECVATLWRCCEHGKLNSLRWMLETWPSDFFESIFLYPLRRAARNGHLEVIVLFFSKFQSWPIVVDYPDLLIYILEDAMEHGHAHIVRFVHDGSDFHRPLASYNSFDATAPYALSMQVASSVRGHIGTLSVFHNLFNISAEILLKEFDFFDPRNPMLVLLKATIEADQFQVMKYLFQRFNLNSKMFTENHMKLLIEKAVECSQLQMLRYLIDTQGFTMDDPAALQFCFTTLETTGNPDVLLYLHEKLDFRHCRFRHAQQIQPDDRTEIERTKFTKLLETMGFQPYNS